MFFDLDRFMSFEGKTGPYLLYQSVRIKSLLRKAAEQGADTLVWLASTPTPQIVQGAYYVRRKVRTPAAHARPCGSAMSRPP